MKIAVFYYSQSGQAKDVAINLCKPLEDNSTNKVVYKEIIPKHRFPFPWSRQTFFDVFPETRLGLPCGGIEPMDLSDIEDPQLVIVVGQTWFLSPSLPLQAFFTDKEVMVFLNGRKIIFVNACRNMWLMTIRKIKGYIESANAALVGHIVLQDSNPNLVSVITVIRWMIYGKKEATRLLPASGISPEIIVNASTFGTIIDNAQDNNFAGLQDRLMEAGAIDYKPSIVFMEKAGHRMFGLWAKFIMQKGSMGDTCRYFRLSLFYYYLLFVLFIISPFGQLYFYLTYALQNVNKKRQIECSIHISNYNSNNNNNK